MYKYLPEYIQDIAVSLKGFIISRNRYNRDFESAYKGYCLREKWTDDQIYLYQKEQRICALKRASNTPYYKQLFQQLGAEWQDFIDENNFSKLPILTKEQISNSVDQFRPRPQFHNDTVAMTSGTTGTSLSLPISNNVESDQWAVWWRYRNWHGIKKGDLCGLFASAPIVKESETQRPFRINWFNNEIRFSIFHISVDTAHLYVEALNKYKPKWIHGNPTAIALFSKYFNEQGLKLNYRVEHLTVGSENLLDWYRESITTAFGIVPRQHYGLAEAVANISECPSGNLHVDEDYSYVEFLPDSETMSQKIIGTNFSNHAVSLLRYHTGDLANVSKGKCECGRPGRIIESLDGRLTDYIVLPGGKRVASLAGPFHSTECLSAAQLYQDNEGKITVRYVPGAGFKNEILIGLESRLRSRIGKEISLRFEKVLEIPKTARGKTKLVVSDYKEND